MQIFQIGRRILHFLVLICTFFLPLFLVLRFHDSLLIKQIGESLSMELSDLLNCAIDYISLVVALLLGIVAYYQTKAINELEYLKYSVFVGIEGMDYSNKREELFEWEDFEKGHSIVQSVSFTEKSLRAYVNMIPSTNSFGSGKLIHIPLIFVTKNEPLIVSINIQAIHVNLLRDNNPIAKKTFRENRNEYHTILNDGDHFNVSLGIIAHDTEIISTIKLAFDLILEDHHGRRHRMRTCATLSNQSDGLFLTSSHTKRLAM